MKSYLILLTVMFLIFSCKEELKPTLSDEKMVEILTDLHLAEAAMLTLNNNLKDSIYVKYYDQIFKIHQATDSVFFKDLEILRKNPKRVEEIYIKVIDNIEQLDLKKAEEEKIEEEESPKKKK